MKPIAHTVLEPELIAEIGRIGEARKPSEACGVLLPYPWRGQRIWELPNRAVHHHNTFEMTSDDIVITLQEWIENTEEAAWDMLTIWHTHPEGQIGPSRSDLENRSVECGNLVVAITENGPVPTWF